MAKKANAAIIPNADGCFCKRLILLGFSFESFAVPNLQIYIPGATYDTTTETWVINSYEYELWVTGANLTIEDVRFAAAVPVGEEGSIEVTWSYSDDSSDPLDYTLIFSHSNTDPYVRVGEEQAYDSYLINISSDSENAPDPMSYYGYAENDTPVFGDGTDIPDHRVFPTNFYEYYIGDFNEQYFKDVYNYDTAAIDSDGNFTDIAQGMTKKFAML